MPEYSKQDLQYAAEFREGIHREALAIVRKTRPDVAEVIDRHPVEDYFQEHWDYPGKWYTMVSIPYGYGSRQALIDAIVRDTLAGKPPKTASAYTQEPPDTVMPEPKKRPTQKEDPFYKLIASYPDLAVDYCIVKNERSDGGYESHRHALKAACTVICDGWEGNPALAAGKRMPAEALFSSDYPKNGLNYRRAFLYPPHENGYTGKDFAHVNAALFPNGTDTLEVFEWTTDWSDYFDEGREWWGTLCVTVYDKTLHRFVVIMASATD